MAGPTSYQFLAVDLVTGDVLEEVVPASGTWERKVNEAGTATLTFHLHQVDPLTVAPHLVAIYVVRDGVCVWAGYAESTKANGNDRTVQVGYVELIGYLHRRVLSGDVIANGVQQTQIVAALIAQANVDGIDLVPVVQAPSSVVRDRTYTAHERPVIGELIANLTEVIGGVDYELRVVSDGAGGWRRDVVISDSLARLLKVTWMAGRDRGGYEVNTEAGDHANRMYATGAGEGPALLVEVAADPPGEYPRFDGVESHRNVTDPNTLDEHAEGSLAIRRRPLATPTLELAVPDLVAVIGTVRPGDYLRVHVDDGAAQFDQLARIVGWTVSWERGAVPTIKFDLATLPNSEADGTRAVAPEAPAPRDTGFAATLQRLDSRLGQLERPTT